MHKMTWIQFILKFSCICRQTLVDFAAIIMYESLDKKDGGKNISIDPHFLSCVSDCAYSSVDLYSCILGYVT